MGNNNIKNATIYFLTSLINAIISVIASVVLTRVFSKETYGLLNLYNSATSLFVGILCFGFTDSYMRFFFDRPNNDSEQKFFKTCIFLPLVGFSIFSIVSNLFFSNSFSKYILGIANSFFTFVFSINIFGQLALRFLNLNYRVRGETKRYSLQSILTQFFLKLFVIISAIGTAEIKSILAFNSFGIFFLSILYFLLQYKSIFGKIEMISFSGYKNVIKFAFFSSPVCIVVYLNTYLIQLIISKNLGLENLGIYSAANLFIFAISIFSASFTTFWGPYFYKNYKEKSNEISCVHEWISFFSVILLIFILIFNDIIYLFIGPNFRTHKEIIGFMLVYPILVLIMETTSYGINIANKNYIILISNSLFVLLNTILSYYLSIKIGLLGVAISSCASSILLFCINTFFGQRFYKTINSPIKTIISVLLIITVSIMYYFLNKTSFICFALGALVLYTLIYLRSIDKLIQFIKESKQRNSIK
ncbi:MAG: lipopolysaccharide biosynthesis protein [Treponema sp.]|nr:lipopolysaccharide biosynthesis protein [Treponema sp.]